MKRGGGNHLSTRRKLSDGECYHRPGLGAQRKAGVEDVRRQLIGAVAITVVLVAMLLLTEAVLRLTGRPGAPLIGWTSGRPGEQNQFGFRGHRFDPTADVLVGRHEFGGAERSVARSVPAAGTLSRAGDATRQRRPHLSHRRRVGTPSSSAVSRLGSVKRRALADEDACGGAWSSG